MGTRHRPRRPVVLASAGVVAALTAGLLAAGCTGSAKPKAAAPTTASATAGPTSSDAPTTAGSAAPGQAPVPAESNPPGDIPDNQVFITYKSDPGAFQVRVPEGWARADATGGVTFTDHLNTVQVTWQPAPTPPSVDRAKSTDVPQLQRSQLAFQLRKVATANLPGGSAVLIDAQENSPPNTVTGKQYRLDVLRYVFFHNGQQAVLALSSPTGADNVDPWKLVSESFRWR